MKTILVCAALLAAPMALAQEPVVGVKDPERPLPTAGEWKTKVVSVVAEGDLVVVATGRELPSPGGGGTYTTTWFDRWRIQGGKADEHWDGAMLPIRP